MRLVASVTQTRYNTRVAYVHIVNGMTEKRLGGRKQRVGAGCKPTQKPRCYTSGLELKSLGSARYRCLSWMLVNVITASMWVVPRKCFRPSTFGLGDFLRFTLFD